MAAARSKSADDDAPPRPSFTHNDIVDLRLNERLAHKAEPLRRFFELHSDTATDAKHFAAGLLHDTAQVLRQAADRAFAVEFVACAIDKGGGSRDLAQQLLAHHGLCAPASTAVSHNPSALADAAEARLPWRTDAATALTAAPIEALKLLCERLRRVASSDDGSATVGTACDAVEASVGAQRVAALERLLAVCGGAPALVHTIQMSAREFGLYDAVFAERGGAALEQQHASVCYYVSDFMPAERWRTVIDEMHERVLRDNDLRAFLVVACHDRRALPPPYAAALQCAANAPRCTTCFTETEAQLAPSAAAEPITFRAQVERALLDEADESVRRLVRAACGSAAERSSAAAPQRRRFVSLLCLRVHGLGAFGAPPPTSAASGGGDEYRFALRGSGVCLVTADLFGVFSNGYGKSTLSITTILWCLTGRSEPRGVAGSKATRVTSDVINDACDEARVSLEIECDDGSGGGDAAVARYTVRRRLTRAGEQSLVVERDSDGERWTRTADAQAIVCGTIFGLDASATAAELRDYLLRTMFLTPRSIESLTHERTRDKFLADLQDDAAAAIERAKSAATQARVACDTAQRTRDSAQSSVTSAQADVERLARGNRVDELSAKIDGTVAQIEALCGGRHRDDDDDACEIVSCLTNAQRDRDEADRVEKRLASTVKRLVVLPRRRPPSSTTVEALRAECDECERRIAHIDDRLRKLRPVDDEDESDAECSRCLAPLDAERLAARRAEWNNERAAAQADVVRLQEQANYIEHADAEREHVEALRVRHERRVAANNLLRDRKAHDKHVKALNALKVDLANERGKMASAESALADRQQALANAEATLRTADAECACAERVATFVARCAQTTWMSTLLRIQRRAQQWIDHLFRPFSFSANAGAAQRHGPPLTLRFRETTGDNRLLTDALVRQCGDDDAQRAKWEPVIVLSRARRERTSLASGSAGGAVAKRRKRRRVGDEESGGDANAADSDADVDDKVGEDDGDARCPAETDEEVGANDNDDMSSNDNGDGSVYALSALSFSEFERVRLALFFAWAEQIMHVRGVYSNVFVLDECFAGVDTFGILMMLVTLRAWATSSSSAPSTQRSNGGSTSTASAAARRHAQFWHRSVFLSSALNLSNIVGFEFDSMIVINKDGLMRA